MKKRLNEMSPILHEPINGICSQYAIWIRPDSKGVVPLMYFQKPRWISKKTWIDLMENIQIMAKKNFEIEVPE